MGGCQSHEYHYMAEIGDETISRCSNCNYSRKGDENSEQQNCPNCNGAITYKNGIEVSKSVVLEIFIFIILTFFLFPKDRTHILFG